MSILEGTKRVLSLFADGATELSFTEVANQLNLPKSSASRLLNQMQNYRLLDQDPATRRYRPGDLLTRAVRVGMAAKPLDDVCRRVLESLTGRSGLTSYLSTLNGADIVVLQRLKGGQSMQVLARPGARCAASETAMGRALLSRLTESEFEAMYGTDASLVLPVPGHDAPSTVGELSARLAQVRHERCALAIDETLPGIGVIAAAVRDRATGEVRGLCLSFDSYQADAAVVAMLHNWVLEAVGELGRQLDDAFWQAP